MNTKPIGDNFILPGSYTLEQLKNIVKLAESAKEKHMNKRHKWADVIIAWAEGKEIQWRLIGDATWRDRIELGVPAFSDENIQWRIKPEPKPDVVVEVHMEKSAWSMGCVDPNLRLTFDGETGKLKQAEVIG